MHSGQPEQMCSEFRRGHTESCIYHQCVFLNALFCTCVWGQPGPLALKPCDSHANNAALCLLLLDSVWHLQQVSLAVVTFTWSWAAEVATPLEHRLMPGLLLILCCR